MDTSKIKKFAIEARNILIQGVAQRLVSLCFRPNGQPTEEPVRYDGGATFMGDTISVDFYDKWMSLKEAISNKGANEVVEEAAYTWFNRLVAIRILARNEIISPVLEYESDGLHIPVIVSEARQGRYPRMPEQQETKLQEYLNDDSLTSDQFRLLITAFCHSNHIINRCFGGINDYTELLLPTNILAEGGFIDLLNHTPFIEEADYRSPELIGWLYQFYISEKKDDVFASFKKGKKAEAKDIPAATQIFTPNWIVKYMVQNTVGRIYLDYNPYTNIKEKLKYLVDNDEDTSEENKLHLDDIHDLTCADLACGSGHILNEIFDLLFDCYEEEGYDSVQAVEDIFHYNLTGIDIDTRAKQLAQFALLLKACQKDNSFADAHCMPCVLDMPKCDRYTWRDTGGHFNSYYSIPANETVRKELDEAFVLMEQADTLGSIMKFTVSPCTMEYIQQAIHSYEENPAHTDTFQPLVKALHIITALSQKYIAIVMNPPYMGSGNMNTELSTYVKKNYPNGKADLFAVFMLVAQNRLAINGKYGMINMQSWMFLSSFEKLRTSLLDNLQIDNMLHLGPRTFDELSGEVVQNTAYVVTNHQPFRNGTYYRLVDGKDCADKEQLFINGEDCYQNVSQRNFEKIPGCPIGYWVSKKIIKAFEKTLIGKISDSRCGLATGNNNYYIRLWYEVDFHGIGFGYDRANAKLSEFKWFPYNNAGGGRKWFGLTDSIINWYNDGNEMQTRLDPSGKRIWAHNFNLDKIFLEHGGWSDISSDGNYFRFYPKGFLFTSNAFFAERDNLITLIGYGNSNFVQDLVKLLNPTMHFTPGNFNSLPYNPLLFNKKIINPIVSKNISISKQDWDAHETSWDFELNQLLAADEQTYIDNIHWMEEQHFRKTGEHICIDPAAPELGSLKWRMVQYKLKWEELFMELHDNEEELNRQFIDIYGLQDELPPDVPLDEITILQQGEISIDNNNITWNDDVIIKQLISYAIGCMMGRYSLDCKGLILANQGDGLKEYDALVPQSRFRPDEDGILPLMSSNSEFADNVTQQFKTWLTIAFGDDTLVENLNFVRTALGKDLDHYLTKDFWKDHKKMYQNRPIYWLFSSKKGAFQCLVYMHRMNPYTAERVRTKYLLPHIEWLVKRQNEMQQNADKLSVRERKELDNIIKQIAECREYHDRLHVVADQQIAFDLDDGVLANYMKFGDVLAKIK